MERPRPPSMPPPPPPPKKKGWKPWKILLLVLGIPLGLFGLLLGCGLLYNLTAKDVPVEERDRRVVLTAQDFAPWMGDDFTVNAKGETISKKKYLGGTYEIEYEYESGAGDEPLFIFCTLNVEENVTDAKATYIGAGIGESLVLGVEDIELRERNDLFSWGSESSLGLLVLEETDAPIGNVFRCRMKNKVFTMTFSGIYFDDAEGLTELLKPLMGRIERYRP